MMNRKQSLRDRPMIRCPKTPNWLTGKHLKQRRASNKVAAVHFSWNCSSAWVPLPPVDSPHMLQNTAKMEHLRGVASDAFTTHSSTQFSSSFQKHLVYWRKWFRRWVYFHWKKLAAVLSSIISSLTLCFNNKQLSISFS